MKTYTPDDVYIYLTQIEDLTNPFTQNEDKDVNRKTLTQALKQFGIPESTYRNWLKEPLYYAYIRELQVMKSYMANHESKAILMDAVNGNKKIPEMERIKLAQSILKNTDREYNIAITQLNEAEDKKIQKPTDVLNQMANLLLELSPTKDGADSPKQNGE